MSSIKVIDNEKVEIIMRQTNYDKDLATKKLLEWDNNYMNVIREYMNPSFQNKKEKKKKSTQQNVISEIRNFMDNVSTGYLQRKEEKNRKEEEEKKNQEELRKTMVKRMNMKKNVLNEIKEKLDTIKE
tara:strand:+ start:551 stop:934 length:384 start_codon:yes stop_codon:yes gene_type:complete